MFLLRIGQPKPQPLHLSKFCLSRYHARLKESSRHNYMQDAWESENYLVLFRQNAQTPPSVAPLHLIMAQIFPWHHHDQIAQPALSQACRPVLCSGLYKTEVDQIQIRSDPNPKRTSDTFAKVRQTR